MKKIKPILSAIIIIICIFTLSANAYFADVNQYNNLPGEGQAHENGTQILPPMPRQADADTADTQESMNVAAAVILSIIIGASIFAVLLSLAVKLRRNK